MRLDLSVVIGYKDWGLDRLVGAVRSLTNSLGDISSEIVVSDYGSSESAGYKEAIEAEGARYVRTETDGVWSRSRALNAGLSVCHGSVLITTDADMVFTPSTFRILKDELERDPQQFMIMQCLDLPEGIDHETIEAGTFSWDQLGRLATMRPRWGMGGMIAVPRWAYEVARGLDERMRIYGGEDIDFARRMQRLGLKQSWLQHPEAMMFHVWHPSSRAAADETPAGRAAIARNRDIQLNDKTSMRNLAEWQFPSTDRDPLVSVVISTFNRAEYLRFAIESTLAQSVRDIELIVVDDGSIDDTAEVVKRYLDPRVKYFYQENKGLAAARNFATHVARGKYIAVMDDDDVMLPTRLEDSLNAVTDGANGAYGGWIDFNSVNGQRNFCTGKRLSSESILFNSAIFLHPTLLVERQWMLAVPYDESLRSGSDYNMAIRMLRSGIKLNHSSRYVLMRRLHEGQITNKDSHIQKSSGAISAFFGRAGMLSPDLSAVREGRAEKDKAPITRQKVIEPLVLEYLPDGAVRRRALVRIVSQYRPDAPVLEVLARAAHRRELTSPEGVLMLAEYLVEDLTLSELLTLRASRAVDVIVETNIVDPEAEITIAEPIKIPALSDDTEDSILVRISDWLSTTGRPDGAALPPPTQGLSSVVAKTSDGEIDVLRRAMRLELRPFNWESEQGSYTFFAAELPSNVGLAEVIEARIELGDMVEDMFVLSGRGLK